MADDEPKDPLPAIREECHIAACLRHHENYRGCVARITAKGDGHCEDWYFDYLHCIDKCANPKIFKVLK